MSKITYLVLAGLVTMTLGTGIHAGYLSVGNPAGGAYDGLQIGIVNVSEGHMEGDIYYVNITLFVNNTYPLGGKIDTIAYDLYWREDNSSRWQYLGDDRISDFHIRPNNNTTYVTTAELRRDEAINAFGVMETQGHIFVRADGVANVSFINGVGYYFDQRVRIED